MLTYQDFLKASEKEDERKNFIMSAINEHQTSENYLWGVEGMNYIRQKNTTIMQYRKVLRTLSGRVVPDNFQANHKIASNFFKRAITQTCNYLLGNGVTFDKPDTKDKMGGDSFDRRMYDSLYESLIGSPSFGFYNNDHVEVFNIREFKPLWDEEDGSLKAGLRYWQLDKNKPMRVTLYEMDGYTDYVENKDKQLEIRTDKRPYRLLVKKTALDGEQIYDGLNYPTFPIVPCWGNKEHQSELVGLKEEIDGHDLISSGMANDMDDVSQIYWIIKNSGGMSEKDLAKFLMRVKTTRTVMTEDDGGEAMPHTIEPPYQSREVYLTRLENAIYYDSMTMNPKDIIAGNVTATAIKAAYDNLDQKVSEIKHCMEEYIEGLLKVAGIEDKPRFKIKRISNDSETTQEVLAAAQYLDAETILRKLPFVEDDEVEDILDRLTREEAGRYVETGQSKGTDGQEAKKADKEASEIL